MSSLTGSTVALVEPGAGSSAAADTAAAVTEAVREAIGEASPRSRDLLLLLCDVDLDRDVAVATASRAVAPARLVACSVDSPFVAARGGGRRCVALYLPSGRVRTGLGWASAKTDGLADAADAAVRAAKADAGELGPHDAVLLLSDASGGDQREVIRAAYGIAGAGAPLVGGALGCVRDPAGVWQSIEGTTIPEAVIAIWISSRSRLGVSFDHGWQPIGPPLHVTRTQGRVVVELDGKAATDAYEEARAAIMPELSGLVGDGVNLPLGVPGDDGRYELRSFLSKKDGGLHFDGHVPEQGIVRLMVADRSSLLAGAQQAIRAAVGQLDEPPRATMMFSCAFRHELLGNGGADEIRAVGDVLDGVPGFGFFTHGEFGKVPGSPGHHTASVTALAL